MISQPLQNETWKKIPGYNYYLSNYNRLKSRLNYEMENDVFLKWKEKNGLYYFGRRKGKRFTLHKAICLIYHPTNNSKRRIKFIDGIKENLTPSNLMWRPEKAPKGLKRIKKRRLHTKPVKLQFPVKGEQNVKAKLNWEQVDRIRETANKIPLINTQILSRIYNVTEQAIINIIRNKSWVKEC